MYPTKNIMKDLKSSAQISQEVLRQSYKIYLIKSRILYLFLSDSAFLLYRRIRISKIRSYQDSEQITDLSGNICSKENRLSKITLYRSDQYSEQIN